MNKIIILDDEEIIRYGLNTILHKRNDQYQVIGEAGDGEEGLRLIKTLHPDVIISDIRMPKLNGLDMIKAISTLKIPCKIIMLTAYADFDYARKAIKFGADSYLLKPINEEELFLELDRLMNKGSEEEKPLEPEEQIAKNLMEEILASKPEIHPLVYKSLKFMFLHFNRNISLQDAANELNVTPAYISKLFSECMNISFVSFLNAYKINIAKKLLLERKYKIQDISEKLGFNNPKYFCKVFGDIENLSPSEFVHKFESLQDYQL